MFARLLHPAPPLSLAESYAALCYCARKADSVPASGPEYRAAMREWRVAFAAFTRAARAARKARHAAERAS